MNEKDILSHIYSILNKYNTDTTSISVNKFIARNKISIEKTDITEILSFENYNHIECSKLISELIEFKSKFEQELELELKLELESELKSKMEKENEDTKLEDKDEDTESENEDTESEDEDEDTASEKDEDEDTASEKNTGKKTNITDLIDDDLIIYSLIEKNENLRKILLLNVELNSCNDLLNSFWKRKELHELDEKLLELLLLLESKLILLNKLENNVRILNDLLLKFRVECLEYDLNKGLCDDLLNMESLDSMYLLNLLKMLNRLELLKIFLLNDKCVNLELLLNECLLKYFHEKKEMKILCKLLLDLDGGLLDVVFINANGKILSNPCSSELFFFRLLFDLNVFLVLNNNLVIFLIIDNLHLLDDLQTTIFCEIIKEYIEYFNLMLLLSNNFITKINEIGTQIEIKHQ